VNQAMLFSNLVEENSCTGHINWLNVPHVVHGVAGSQPLT